MHPILVTSLDGLSRNSAAFSLAGRSSGTPVVLHDLLDAGVVVRRVHGADRLVERESMVLEHGCLSCTVRFDLAPMLLQLAEDGATRVIVGLPPGTTAEDAIEGLRTVAPRAFTVDTIALTVRLEDLEDQLWDHHTLFESGYTAMPEDSRTPGEFLIGEFLFADTVVTITNDHLPSDPTLWDRGLHLIGEVAPHATIVHVGGNVDPDGAARPLGARSAVTALGMHDLAGAHARSLPGTILAPATSPWSTGSPDRSIPNASAPPLAPSRRAAASSAGTSGSREWTRASRCTGWARGSPSAPKGPGTRVRGTASGVRVRTWPSPATTSTTTS